MEAPPQKLSMVSPEFPTPSSAGGAAPSRALTSLSRTARDALQRGIRFILSRQRDDGLWVDFWTRSSGQSTLWVTGYISHALQEAGCADIPEVSRCCQALLKAQHPNGGWGYNADVPPDADSTAFCLLGVSAAPNRDQERVERGVAFLGRHQRPDGGFATYASQADLRRYRQRGQERDYSGWCASHVEVTAASALALLAASCQATAEGIARAARFILNHQNPECVWASYWWRGPLYATAWALVTLQHCRQDLGLTRESAILRWLEEAQERDGGWGNSLDDGSCAFSTALACIALGHVRPATPIRMYSGVSWLIHRQQDDGSWAAAHRTFQIPPPTVADAADVGSWRLGGPGVGSATKDENRLFTTATGVMALAGLIRTLHS